jgi:hypothetical protein
MLRRPLAPAALALLVAGCALLAVPARADFRLAKELPLAPGGALLVRTDGGSVTVTGGAGEGATIVITSQRDDIPERYRFDFKSEGGRAEVIGERRVRGLARLFDWESDGRLHIEVKVPRTTRVDLQSSGGGIRIGSLAGDARLRSSGGGLRALEVAGNVDASTSGGGIDMQQIVGDLEVDTSGGGIRIAAVTGNVKAQTSGGGIDIDGVGGDVDAGTSGGGVDIRDVRGRVAAHSSGGPVTATLGAGSTAGGSLSSSGGGVRVRLDPAVRLTVDASSSGGSVRCDLPVRTRGKVRSHSLHGDLNGGGPTLTLRSSGGGIRIAAADGDDEDG